MFRLLLIFAASSLNRFQIIITILCLLRLFRTMTSICFVCNLPIMSHQVGLVWQGSNGWDDMVREQVRIACIWFGFAVILFVHLVVGGISDSTATWWKT